MASIKGFELKAIKYFEGMEGTGFNSNLYYNGKKVGTANDHATGGPLDYRVEDKKVESKLEEVAKEFGNTGFGAVDIFIGELETLKMLETDFKKAIKKGYGSIAYLTDSYDRKGPVKVPVVYSIPKNYEGEINVDGYDNVTEYKSLDDFNIL